MTRISRSVSKKALERKNGCVLKGEIRVRLHARPAGWRLHDFIDSPEGRYEVLEDRHRPRQPDRRKVLVRIGLRRTGRKSIFYV